MIWKQPATVEGLNQFAENTMTEYLGIEIIEVGDDFLKAKMPVDHRTVQPFRILHGGASVVLAETLGSIGATLCLDDMTKQHAVGLEINANHLRAEREGGYVIGTARPIKIGRIVHVWQIDIEGSNGKMVCRSRLTMAIVDAK